MKAEACVPTPPCPPLARGGKDSGSKKELPREKACGPRGVRPHPPCPPVSKGGKRMRLTALACHLYCHPGRGIRTLHPRRASRRAPGTDSPLVKLLKSGRVPEARQGTIVDMIGKRGTAGDLAFLFQQVISPDGFSAPIKLKALEALAEAASNRNLRPAKDARQAGHAASGRLRLDRNQAFEKAAVRLAGLWKLEAAADALGALAVSPTADDWRSVRRGRGRHWPSIGGTRGAVPDRGPDRAGPARGHSHAGGRVPGQARRRRRGSAGRRDPGARRRAGARPHSRSLAAFLNRQGGADVLAAALGSSCPVPPTRPGWRCGPSTPWAMPSRPWWPRSPARPASPPRPSPSLRPSSTSSSPRSPPRATRRAAS